MTRKFSIGILDDEQSALNLLEKFIKSDPDFDIVFIEQNPIIALDIALSQNLDLVITDIHMPITNGIWIAEKLIENNISVAVTSGVWESAHMCVNMDILGFIHKPLTQKGVSNILLKFKSSLVTRPMSVGQLQDSEIRFLKNVNPTSLIAFNPKEIICIKGAKDYAEIFFDKGSPKTKILFKKSLKGIINSIDNPYLIQVHKSYIINFKKIIECDYAKVTLESGIEVPIGISFRTQLFDLLYNNIL